jgi:predicted phosphohydrolase
MKLQILSDLHTEFAEFSPPETGADVVILAGDIGVGLGGIEWAASQFPNQPVIYVPGNHEYYGHDITLIDELVKQSPENIHVLNNDAMVLNGVRFLGSTLWTDFRLDGESEHALPGSGPGVLWRTLPSSSLEVALLRRKFPSVSMVRAGRGSSANSTLLSTGQAL